MLELGKAERGIVYEKLYTYYSVFISVPNGTLFLKLTPLSSDDPDMVFIFLFFFFREFI